MGRFVLMRLAGLTPVLLILSIITFALMHEVPGAPWKYGQRPFSAEQIAALKARYGLDKPVWEQYLIWLGGVLRLDFGMPFDHPDESVIGLIRRTWPITAHLGLMALLIAFGFGIPLGVIAALKQNTWIDYADYVRTARAKGLHERSVVLRHVMKNALIPMITVFGPIVPDLITGSIFIEAIVRVPGLGAFWVTSTTNRDYPMIIGLTMLWAVLIAVTYLITDILYVFVDPRVHFT
jgi:oligopeptide transport system permease protein